MKTYGYCRISTPKQSIDRQIRNILNEYPEAVIVAEAYTGTKIHRPKWDRLCKALAAGDTIVFDSVSRMSRDAENGFTVYEELYNMGVNLVFLKEPMINTDTYRNAVKESVPMTGTAVDCILEGVNKYLLNLAREQIRLAFGQAEKEVQDLRQRTKEGIETARLQGKQIGLEEGRKLTTKKGETAKTVIASHSKDFGGTLSDSDCQTLAKVSRNTYYKHKAELKRLYSEWASDAGAEPEWWDSLTTAEAEIVAQWNKNTARK